MTKIRSIVLTADKLTPELTAAVQTGTLTSAQTDALMALVQGRLQRPVQPAKQDGEFALVLPVSKLPYESIREDVCEWQEDRDYESEYQPKDVGNNRFTLGYTAFFCGVDKDSDSHEVCKAILPEVYDWLTEHAPNANIEMGQWDMDDPADFDRDDDEDIDEDELGGDATVWVNFDKDDATAVAFKLRFG